SFVTMISVPSLDSKAALGGARTRIRWATNGSRRSTRPSVRHWTPRRHPAATEGMPQATAHLGHTGEPFGLSKPGRCEIVPNGPRTTLGRRKQVRNADAG